MIGIFHRLNPCRDIPFMCSKYSDLEGFDPRGRKPSKKEIIATRRLERMLCRFCKDNCKEYIKKRKIYKHKRMFKNK